MLCKDMIQQLKSSLIIGIGLLSLLGCNTAKQIAIAVVEPAPVSLDRTIKRIGVVNMHLTDNTQKSKTGMDLLISRDDDFLKEKGTDAAIEGLFKNLNQDPRFDAVVLLQAESAIVRDQEGRPDETSWKMIQALCERHNLDAIFALAYYHADTEITLKKSKIHQRDLMRLEVDKKGHELTLETLIENGWRIYDPFQKEVLDEFTFKEQLTARARGSSPLRAYHAIGSRQDSLVLKSRITGEAYGSRLRPYKSTIYRSYHAAGTDNFISAKERVEEKDWEGAVSLWKKELSNDKVKFRAMACHNLAVVHEAMENLEEALVWALKSDEYLSSKTSRLYIDELEDRISQNHLVNEQLSQLGR
ncbi:MAG: hypothetical protein KJO20_06210 [Eudoraea sp.]|nr:hypothetical protein [Eudoraea sp.]NNK29311.1 hypothetical protein [Flavobacteriaceae bacterium]